MAGERVRGPYCYSRFVRTALSEGKFVVLSENIRCCGFFWRVVVPWRGFGCGDEQNAALYFP